MAFTTKTNPVLAEAILCFDPYDSWGWNSEWWFAIADYLTDLGYDAPEYWEFRKSAFGSDMECYEYQSLSEIQGVLTPGIVSGNGYSDEEFAEILIHAGNVMAHYGMILKSSGKDY